MSRAYSQCKLLIEKPLVAGRPAARTVAASMALAPARADLLALALSFVVAVAVVVVAEPLGLGIVVDDGTAVHEPARGCWSG